MDVTKSGFKKCQKLIKMTVTFRDGTETEYWVMKGSVDTCNYVTINDIALFKFDEYKSVDEGNEFNGMFHGGGAAHTPHMIPTEAIRDVQQHPDYLFAGEGELYFWRDPEDGENFVVAGEEWVENLV